MKRIGLYVIVTLIFFSCNEKEIPATIDGTVTQFTSIPSSRSGVTFTNTLSNSEYFNIIKTPNFYDGGGVAIGDVNNDGLADIYFSSNQWQNKLYLNKGNFKFEDITAKAGVGGAGNWKTGVAMVDINGDGLLDIYVCTGGNQQPFQGMNQFYVNNGDLTFTDRASEYGLALDSLTVQAEFYDINDDRALDVTLTTTKKRHIYLNNGAEQPHFIEEAVFPIEVDPYTGADLADINEDGFTDEVRAGAFPFNDKIIKTTSLGHPNTLRVHNGIVKGESLLTESAAFAGVAATDQSWAPLLADFDNDGRKDLFITTGVVGRTNDLDYLQRISDKTLGELTTEQRIQQMPQAALPNFFFRNVDGLRFEDKSEWLGTPDGFSNGASYGDLDNDGDVDLVVNNINAEAFILRNNADHDSTTYITIKLDGLGKNRFGVGAYIKVYADGKLFSREQSITRGWLSSVDPVINIGLGKTTKVDSLLVIWRNLRSQKLTNVSVNETLILKEQDARDLGDGHLMPQSLLERTAPFAFTHVENEFNTLDRQPLIPHASSSKGPKIAVGDINGDRLQDLFICGGQGQPGMVVVQTRAGKFVPIPQPAFEEDKRNEETCAALFDVDGDKDLDLMIGSGGEEFLDKRTMMRLYLNNGRGTFTKTDKSLPKIYVNATCIVSADVDNDKDLDVFVGGGVITGRYGFDSDSFILTNDGKGVFTGSATSFFERRNVGDMIQAAVWIDVNKDEYPDLVTAGDWTQIQVWINENGVLKRQVENGLDEMPDGWWTSLAHADMDNDGDDDIIAGNFGTNQRIQQAELLVSDLDNNGSLEPIMSYSGVPLPLRDRVVKQVPALAKKYPTYADYAGVRIEQMVTGRQAFHRSVGTMHSLYIENLGNGKFSAKQLPNEAQLFPVFGINISDINSDGNRDILLAGNLKAVPAELWRQDHGYGLVLAGNGKGEFKAVPPGRSGFVIKGEGRDIQSVINFRKEEFYLVARNNDTLLVFKKKIK